MRIAVISDIHSNLPALEAVLDALGDVDAYWHLGDIVGYGPHPDEVVDRLREIGAVGVLGNHDAAALGGLEVEWFNPEARQAIQWTARRISPRTRAWLEALPERLELDGMTLVHGSARDPITEYVTSTRSARASFSAFTTPCLLHGHTHVPAAWREEGTEIELLGPSHGSELLLDDRRVLLNPGSVGQPRDRNWLASFATFKDVCYRFTYIKEEDMSFRFVSQAINMRRVPYDIKTTIRKIKEEPGLPGTLGDRLTVGL